MFFNSGTNFSSFDLQILLQLAGFYPVGGGGGGGEFEDVTATILEEIDNSSDEHSRHIPLRHNYFMKQ